MARIASKCLKEQLAEAEGFDMSVLKVHEGPRGARQTKPKRAGGKLGGAGGGAHSRPETAFDVSASGARPPSAKRALRPHTVQVDPRQLDEYAASLGFEATATPVVTPTISVGGTAGAGHAADG